jgi:hypothetical protein
MSLAGVDGVRLMVSPWEIRARGRLHLGDFESRAKQRMSLAQAGDWALRRERSIRAALEATARSARRHHDISHCPIDRADGSACETPRCPVRRPEAHKRYNIRPRMTPNAILIDWGSPP